MSRFETQKNSYQYSTRFFAPRGQKPQTKGERNSQEQGLRPCRPYQGPEKIKKKEKRKRKKNRKVKKRFGRPRGTKNLRWSLRESLGRQEENRTELQLRFPAKRRFLTSSNKPEFGQSA